MAKSFFAKYDIPYTEKDVTANSKYMQELEKLAGRFITPTLVIDGEVLIGFSINLPLVRQLLEERGDL